MKKIFVSLMFLFMAALLTACGKGDGTIVSTKGKNDEALKVQLIDVWQDADQKVMVTVKGLGPGKLLDIAAQPTGRFAMPHIKVRILSDNEWLEKEEYPQGMFSNDENGSFTVRYAATKMPSQVEIGGQVIELDKVKLAGTDHQALVDAETEVYRAREEAERQKAEAAQQRFDSAEAVAPKSNPDLAWTNDISLAKGEKLYYGITGLKNADSAVVSFVLSADGTQAHTIRVDLKNGRAGNTIYNKQHSILLSYPVKDNHLSIDSGDILLDVTIDGDSAEGVFEFSVEGSKKDIWGRSTYTSLGIARIEMSRR